MADEDDTYDPEGMGWGVSNDDTAKDYASLLNILKPAVFDHVKDIMGEEAVNTPAFNAMLDQVASTGEMMAKALAARKKPAAFDALANGPDYPNIKNILDGLDKPQGGGRSGP